MSLSINDKINLAERLMPHVDQGSALWRSAERVLLRALGEDSIDERVVDGAGDVGRKLGPMRSGVHVGVLGRNRSGRLGDAKADLKIGQGHNALPAGAPGVVVKPCPAPLRTALLAWRGDRSEAEAAAKIGVAPNTLGNWTDGRHRPPTTRLPSLAAALGIPLADLAAMVARERKRRLVGRGAHGGASRRKPISRRAAKGQR